MSEFSNVAGVIGVRGEPGMALVHYLRRAPDRTIEQERVATDAYVQGYQTGYRHGGKDCLEASTELNTLLSDRRFATALAAVARFIEAHTPPDPPPILPATDAEIEWMPSKEALE